jgi:hypothetical protein
MSNPYYPTQIGYLPTGIGTGANVSTLVLGRYTSGNGNTYEGVGFGLGGRPDYAQVVQINITDRATNGTLTQNAWININVADIIAMRTQLPVNPYFPSQVNMTLKEVSVCEVLDSGPNIGDTVERKMIILSSQTYPTGVGGL